MPEKGYRQITLKEDDYWKLASIKIKLRAKTWSELIEKLYRMIIEEG